MAELEGIHARTYIEGKGEANILENRNSGVYAELIKEAREVLDGNLNKLECNCLCDARHVVVEWWGYKAHPEGWYNKDAYAEEGEDSERISKADQAIDALLY